MPRPPARALPLTLLLLSLTAACGTDAGPEPKAAAKPSAVPPAPAKVEVIADLADCEANIRIEADELREGVCTSSDGDLVITTFPKEKYKVTWLESASVYGGRYLVGPRWAISAKPAVLKQLRPKVGGTIQQLEGTRPNDPSR